MSPYLITGIAAGFLGIAIGVGGTYALDANHYGAQLDREKAMRARDNEQHANDLNVMSKAALDAEDRAIAAHDRAASEVAAADAQYLKEKEVHEADNARNRNAIADGTRRLRIAVTNFAPVATGGDKAGGGASAGSLGYGAGGTADLSPAFGVALFGIADDADGDARAKADYLQHYVCILEQQGLIAGACPAS